MNIHCLILNFILGAFSSKTRHGPCLCYEDPEKSRHAGKGAGEITENIHLFIKHLFVWCIYSWILCFCWLGTQGLDWHPTTVLFSVNYVKGSKYMYCVEIYVIIKKGLKFQYAGSHALLVFRVFLVMSYKFLKLFFFLHFTP